jgi:excisionase family DNA binding protein
MAAKTHSVHQHQESEGAEIQELYRLFMLEKAPALIGPNHESIPLPESIYKVLLQVLGYMAQGKAVSVAPVMQELTTQHAANLLGVSRPFFVRLLNEDKIPFHRTGTHRRVYRKDVIEFRNKRDAERKTILNDLAVSDIQDGTYDQIHVDLEKAPL